jgi:hypothetical protein
VYWISRRTGYDQRRSATCRQEIVAGTFDMDRQSKRSLPMARSPRRSRSQKDRHDEPVDCLWVLGFDDHARDRYRDPPSPLSRAYLAGRPVGRDTARLHRSIGRGFVIATVILVLAVPPHSSE